MSFPRSFYSSQPDLRLTVGQTETHKPVLGVEKGSKGGEAAQDRQPNNEGEGEGG